MANLSTHSNTWSYNSQVCIKKKNPNGTEKKSPYLDPWKSTDLWERTSAPQKVNKRESSQHMVLEQLENRMEENEFTVPSNILNKEYTILYFIIKYKNTSNILCK